MSFPFKTPFALDGSKTAIPLQDSDGNVNFEDGYTQYYEINPDFDPVTGLPTNPDAKLIERDKTNWLFYQITDSIRDIQLYGFPSWFPPAEFSAYPLGAVVVHEGAVYQSTAAANTTVPGAVGANWKEGIVGAASETVSGFVQLATEEETFEQASGEKAVHPEGLSRYVRSVAKIADLRALQGSADGQQVELLGGVIAGVGGGTFYRVTNGALSDDGRDIIRYADTDTYWVRQDLAKYQIKDVAEHNGLVFNERDDTQLSVSMRRNYKYKIELPTEFNPSLYLLSDINIYFKGGRYWSDFDVRTLRPVRAEVRYVNPARGSDDNDGLSWGTAYATVRKALEIAATVDLEIRVAPGVYYFIDGPQGFNPSRGVTIICDQGIAEFRNQATPRLWTESPTYPGLYTTLNLQNGEDWTGRGLDLRFYLQSTGVTTAGGTRLPEVSVGALQAGSVGVSIGVTSTAVRLPNDVNPNTVGTFHVNWVSNNIRVICPPGEDHVIYTENIKAIFGSNHTAYFETATEGSQCIHVNCEFSDGHANNSATWLVGGLVVNVDCQAHRGFKDGFNYHVNGASSGRTSVLEINCKAHFNGRDSSGVNNGSTAHESVRIIRIGGDYSCNQNRNVHDINGSKSFNVGCKAKRTMDNNSASFAFGRSGQGDQTIGWMVGCETDVIDVYDGARFSISDDTTYRDLQVESGGTVIDYNP